MDNIWTNGGDESCGGNVSDNGEDGLGNLPDVLSPQLAAGQL